MIYDIFVFYIYVCGLYRGEKMKQVWIDNFRLGENDPLTQSVSDFLGLDDFNVELFNVSFYDEKLPEDGNFQIVDYGSREILYDGMEAEKEIEI